MKFYLLHPDDRDRWEITTEEPQSTYAYKKTTNQQKIEPQIIEYPPTPYQELTEDEVIEIVLEEEQNVVEQGLDLLQDNIKEDIKIFYDLVTVYEQLDNIKEMLNYVEEVKLTFGNEIEWVKFKDSGWDKYTITIKGNQHKISFANAIEGLFNKEEVVEIEYED